MTTISLAIPDDIYERLHREAEQTNRSIEVVLIEDLSLLSGKSLMDLTVQDSFSDEKLWAIVHQQPDKTRQQRIQQLISRGKRRELSPEERAELDQLIDLDDHFVLLLLKKRGHDISGYFAREK